MLLMNIFVILTPFAWAAAWVFALRAILKEPKSWRNRISIGSLGLLTLIGLLWLPVAVYSSGTESAASAGFAVHMKNVQEWSKFAGRGCVLPLVLSFFGRPRLIAPIAMACIGTALFWFFTAYMY